MSKSSFQRWYEKDPYLKEAMAALEVMPVSIQRLIAQQFLSVCDMRSLMRQQARASRGLKSLGNEKLKGLLASKAKRRWYDTDPVVHTAITRVHMMDEEQRQVSGLKLLLCCKTIEKYLIECGVTHVIPIEKEMKTMVAPILLSELPQIQA